MYLCLGFESCRNGWSWSPLEPTNHHDRPEEKKSQRSNTNTNAQQSNTPSPPSNPSSSSLPTIQNFSIFFFSNHRRQETKRVPLPSQQYKISPFSSSVITEGRKPRGFGWATTWGNPLSLSLKSCFLFLLGFKFQCSLIMMNW